MRLHDLPIDDPAVQDMKSEILASIALEEEEHNKFSLLSLVWDNTDLRAGRRIRISFMILSLQQMMGEEPLTHQIYATDEVQVSISRCITVLSSLPRLASRPFLHSYSLLS